MINSNFSSYLDNNLYELGLDAEKNKLYDIAFSYFYKASALGDYKACNHLGYLYEKGIGTSIDYLKAKEYYQKAFNHNEFISLYNISLLYLKGLGVKKDVNYAIELLNKSLNDYQISKAGIILSKIYKEGLDEIKADKKLSYEYLLKSESLGEKDAYYYLGIRNYLGEGTVINKNEAIRYFTLGAENQDKRCYYHLGLIYLEEKNYSKASYWFNIGAINSDPKCMYNLGIFYLKGIYFSKNEEKGNYWINKSKGM